MFSKFLTSLPPRRLSSKHFPISSRGFWIWWDVFSSSYSLKLDKSHRAIMFCIFLHFFRSVSVRGSAFSSLGSCKRHFFYFTREWTARWPLLKKEIDLCSLVSNKLYHKRLRFQSNIPSSRWYICSHRPNMVSARWLWRISQPGMELIGNGEIFWMNYKRKGNVVLWDGHQSLHWVKYENRNSDFVISKFIINTNTSTYNAWISLFNLHYLMCQCGLYSARSIVNR